MTRRRPITVNTSREELHDGNTITVSKYKRKRHMQPNGVLSTKPASVNNPWAAGPSRDLVTIGNRGGALYDPAVHVNQHAEVVVPGEPVDRHGPNMCETPIRWRIFGRIDRGPWRWEVCGESITSCTFSQPAQVVGHKQWLEQQAKANGLSMEFIVVPVYAGKRAL